MFSWFDVPKRLDRYAFHYDLDRRDCCERVFSLAPETANSYSIDERRSKPDHPILALARIEYFLSKLSPCPVCCGNTDLVDGKLFIEFLSRQQASLQRCSSPGFFDEPDKFCAWPVFACLIYDHLSTTIKVLVFIKQLPVDVFYLCHPNLAIGIACEEFRIIPSFNKSFAPTV